MESTQLSDVQKSPLSKLPFPYIEMYGHKKQQFKPNLDFKSEIGEKLQRLTEKVRNREQAHVHKNTLSYAHENFSVDNVLGRYNGYKVSPNATPTYKLRKVQLKKPEPSPKAPSMHHWQDMLEMTERYAPKFPLNNRIRDIMKMSFSKSPVNKTLRVVIREKKKEIVHKLPPIAFDKAESKMVLREILPENWEEFKQEKSGFYSFKNRKGETELVKRGRSENQHSPKRREVFKRLPKKKTCDANVFVDFSEADFFVK